MIAHRTQARRRWLFGGNAPEISVSPSSWGFGSTPVGTPVEKEFTIQNTGTAALEITLPITIVGDGFTVTAQPSVTSLAPGDSTTFTVQASAASVDTFNANISIANNSSENPKLVAITVNVEIDYILDDNLGLTAVYAYGTKLLRRQYAGQCLRLRRASDNAESDFGFDSQGDLDIVAISTWLNGNAGFVRTWYDQSGNGYNAANATAAGQPMYTASAIIGRPGVVNGENLKLTVPNTGFLGRSAATIFAVARLNADDVKTSSAIFGMNNGSTDSAFALELLSANPGSTGALRLRYGSPNLAQSSTTYEWNDPKIVTGRATNGSPIRLRVNGVAPAYSTQNNAATLPATFPSSAAIGQDSDTRSVSDFNGSIGTVILMPSDLSDSACAEIEAKIGAYYS